MIVPARTVAEKITLLSYLADKTKSSPHELVGQMPFEIVAVGGGPSGAMGVVLYTNFRGRCLEMSCAGEGAWLTRGHLRAFFHFPFVQMGVWTVMATVERGNDKSRALARRLGFTEKCVLEHGVLRSKDTMLYAMTAPQCRWLADPRAANRAVEVAA